MTSDDASRYYQALVDIGSNGIRFSITDLSPSSARLLPSIYQDRCGISLYDAQYSTGTKQPIPSSVIDEVLVALLQFKRTLGDFGVPERNIRLVATEATRNATNRDSFLDQIKERTGWGVQLLVKEDEGKLGAMGIASSLACVEGICMDMGGGSVQMTWVVKKSNGELDMSPVGSVSFPYGAAALMKNLSVMDSSQQRNLQMEVATKVQTAIANDLQIPTTLREAAQLNGGYNLYLIGGGFRGWGYVLMTHDRNQPYPIPTINGYTVTADSFFSSHDVSTIDPAACRISSRRASQFPAVRLIIDAIKEAQIPISNVTFSQGGVREGLLYSDLEPSLRAQHPLNTATLSHAPRSQAVLNKLLHDAIPIHLGPELLAATTNLLYAHCPLPKDVRAAAALRTTTTGILAGANGLSHHERAILGLILCERWGGELSIADTGFLKGMENVCGPALAWWSKFIGRIVKGIAEIYPAGVVRTAASEHDFTMRSRLSHSLDEIVGPNYRIPPPAISCSVEIFVQRNEINGVVREWVKQVKKLGKRKNWIKGYGLHVEAEVNYAK